MQSQVISIFLVAATVVFVFFIEKQKTSIVQKVLNWFPAILFAYVIPALVTYIFRLDLSTVALHSLSKSFIMPLAIIAVMSALSIKQLRVIGIRPIIVFVSGSFAVAILPVLLYLIFTGFSEAFTIKLIDEEYWKGLVTIVGSWVGGSTSQLVLKEVVECPESIFLNILIMDNVLVNIWTIIMFQFIKRSESWNRFFGINDRVMDFIPDEILIESKGRTAVITTFGICIVSVIVVYFLPIPFLIKVLSLSALGLLFGNLIPKWNHAAVLKMGGILIVLIMAILGLKLNFDNFEIPFSIVLFAVLWIIMHYVVMLVVAKLLKLNMAWVPISSMANVGGISTAPAVTKAYNEEWMPHAILLAILSMVSGTLWGLLTIFLFQNFIL